MIRSIEIGAGETYRHTHTHTELTPTHTYAHTHHTHISHTHTHTHTDTRTKQHTHNTHTQHTKHTHMQHTRYHDIQHTHTTQQRAIPMPPMCMMQGTAVLQRHQDLRSCSRHVMSYHVTSCHVMSCHVASGVAILKSIKRRVQSKSTRTVMLTLDVSGGSTHHVVGMEQRLRTCDMRLSTSCHVSHVSCVCSCKLLEMCVKNCHRGFHAQLAQKENLDAIVEVRKRGAHVLMRACVIM